MRTAIKKSVRFEVFKRDSFTCQYCGRSSPDIVLHLEHIDPVANGGTSDILNLVTSCSDCNLGKGSKTLSDHTALAKQKKQLDDLNQRREQLEMLVEWRTALSDIADQEVEAFENALLQKTNFGLSDSGRADVKKWIKRFGFAKTLSALDGSLSSYYRPDAEPEDRRNSVGKSINMVPRVATAQSADTAKPWMKDLYYIRGIVRNRGHCVDHVALKLLVEAYECNLTIECLRELALTSRNWSQWKATMIDWIEQSGEGL